MSSKKEMTVLPKEEKGNTVTDCNNNPVGVERTTSGGFRSSRRVVDDDDLITECVALRKDLHCKYCKKKFSNSQALGGHQNAHKRERALEKMEEIALASVAASSSFVPPSTLSSTCYTMRLDVPPLASSLLGVRSRSAIHKPFIRSWLSSGGGAGGGWWWLPTHSNNLNRRISSTLMALNPEQTHLPGTTPPPYCYSPGINSAYWVFEHQPPPETTATDFNHGGGGGTRLLMAALQPPFAGEGGGSHDDHSENDDKEKEEGEASEIDLTLTL